MQGIVFQKTVILYFISFIFHVTCQFFSYLQIKFTKNMWCVMNYSCNQAAMYVRVSGTTLYAQRWLPQTYLYNVHNYIKRGWRWYHAQTDITRCMLSTRFSPPGFTVTNNNLSFKWSPIRPIASRLATFRLL